MPKYAEKTGFSWNFIISCFCFGPTWKSYKLNDVRSFVRSLVRPFVRSSAFQLVFSQNHVPWLKIFPILGKFFLKRLFQDDDFRRIFESGRARTISFTYKNQINNSQLKRIYLLVISSYKVNNEWRKRSAYLFFL